MQWLDSRKYSQQILLTLSAGAAVLLSVGLMYWLTFVVYSTEADFDAAKTLFRGRVVVFLVLSIMICCLAVYLHLSGSTRIENPLWLMMLVPVAAALCFIKSIYFVFVVLLVVATWAIAQYRVILIEDDYKEPVNSWGTTFKNMATARNISGLLLVAVSIFLWRTAYDWAFKSVQRHEIQAKGLYAEVSSVRQLVDAERAEYVRFMGKLPAAHFATSERFGSGDDSYWMTYALLAEQQLKEIYLPRWPVWVLCEDKACRTDENTIFRVHRCRVEKECSSELLKIRLQWLLKYATQGLLQNPEAADNRTLVLLELTPERTLSYGDMVWRRRMYWGLMGLAVAQFLYTLFHIFAMRELGARLPIASNT